jgi:hypothetical protein
MVERSRKKSLYEREKELLQNWRLLRESGRLKERIYCKQIKEAIQRGNRDAKHFVTFIHAT